MTISEVRRRLDRLQRDGSIDRWKQIGDAFWVQAYNSNEWHLYWEDVV